MAQVVRYGEVDLKSLFSQAKEMEKVGLGYKMSGAFVPAEKLNYVSPEDWIITPTRAELKGSRVLHADGKCQTVKLDKLCYDVSFVVELKDNFNIATPVILTLTLPDGTTQKMEYLLMAYPRTKPLMLKAGEFDNKFECGDIKFALEGSERVTLKEGLVIYGVSVSPIINK